MARRAARGFSVVEALVAIILLAAAGTGMAMAFTAAGSLRTRALAERAVADDAVSRMGMLARRPCSAPDTSGTDASGRVVLRWGAVRSGDDWVFADSALASGGSDERIISGRVSCRR